MNLLVVVWKDPLHPDTGGVELNCAEVFSRIAASGNSVSLLSHRFKGAAEEEDYRGIRIVRRAGPGSFLVYLRSKLASFVLEGGYDAVVDIVDSIPMFAACFSGRPSVVLFHKIAASSFSVDMRAVYSAVLFLRRFFL